MSRLLRVFVTVQLICLSLTAYSLQPPTYSQNTIKEYMTSWLMAGPFPTEGFSSQTDYLQSQGGEENLSDQFDIPIEFQSKQFEWFEYSGDTPELLLHEIFQSKDRMSAYAYCEIKIRKERLVHLALGSNDSIRVWLNNKNVFTFAGPRTLQLDQNIVPVQLNAGLNRLLVRVDNEGNQWGFACRILPFQMKAYKNQTLLDIQHSNNQWNILPFDSADTAVRVLDQAKITLQSIHEPPGSLFQTTWTHSKPIQPVKFDIPNQYRKYQLKIDRTFKNGKTDTVTRIITLGPIVRYTLFEKRRTGYRIVLGENASDSEKWAVKELQKWLYEISDTTFPVVSDTTPVSPHEIVVGINSHTRSIKKESVPAPPSLDESFTIENIGPHILIYGGAERGTMYGVMDFLETYFGCRWYTPTVSVIPKKEKYEFLLFDRKDYPRLRVRNDFYFEAFEPIWAARNKVNGAMGLREQPGGVEGYWAVHTFYPIIPPEEFFEDHPEYFSLIDGKRTHEHAQLCLTNQDVLNLFIERIKNTIRENPDYLIYSVSQNDWYGPCECESCSAIAKREESEAGPLLYFVNQVADSIKNEFPDKYIGTLAYQYTRKAPKTIQPRDNVVIRLCSIECCFSHSFYDCPQNQDFLQDLRDWAKIAPSLYIWDYVVNFRHYILPHPNFYVLQPNLQAFRDNKAIGVMEQAAYNSRGGEFSELKAYLLAKLLWNPDEKDVDAIIDDFMLGYYGRAGQYIREYFDLLHNSVSPTDHLRIFDGVDHAFFNEDFIRTSEALFDQAEAVAETVDVLHRVEMARLPLMYLTVKTDFERAWKNGTCERFKEICRREGIERHSEHNPITVLWDEIESRTESMNQ